MKKISYPHKVRVGNSEVTIYKRETGSGNVGFRVAFIDVDGSRRMVSESDEQTALDIAEQKALALSTHGAKVALVSPDEIATYVHASESLKPFGVSVRDGVERLVGWLKSHLTLAGIDGALVAQKASGLATVAVHKPLHAARLEFIAECEQKVARGTLSEMHVQDVDLRLIRILQPFNCDVDSMDTAMLQTRLDAMNGGASNYDHNRRVLSSFFSWCYCQKYHVKNPAFTPRKSFRVQGEKYLEKREIPVGKKHIFHVEEMEKLLAAAKELDDKLTAAELQPYYLPLVVFCGFAGLRTSEFSRLKWEDIDLATGRMIVGADEGKTTDSHRSMELTDNVRKWLKTLRDKKFKGFVFTNRGENFLNTFQRTLGAQKIVAKASGVAWKQNAPRHSYISYRILLKHTKADVAADAGNSPAIINSNYKVLRYEDGRFITARDAKAWFSLEIPKVK